MILALLLYVIFTVLLMGVEIYEERDWPRTTCGAFFAGVFFVVIWIWFV